METFNNETQYKEYLNNKFKNLNKKEEFNIFLHIITVFSHDMCMYRGKTQTEILNQKAQSIMNQGLALDYNPTFRYSAMSGTTHFMGNAKDADMSKIIDYVYDQYKDEERKVVVFAVPKYIQIDDQSVEFSSYKGVGTIKMNDIKEVTEEIISAYKERGVDHRDLHHTKCSLLDCVLSHKVPKEYILGVQTIDPINNVYSFTDNEKHISNMDKETREKFDSLCVERIKSLNYDAEKDNRLEVFTEKTRKDKQYLDDLLYEDI